MQSKSGDACDAGEILVQTEETCLMLKSYGGYQGIDGCETDAPRPSQPGNRGGLTVGGKTARLEHLPQGKIALDAIDISPKPLQDLRHNNSSDREGLDFINHPTQFTSSAAGRRAKKINPDGSIHQDQARFLRIRLRSPFQIPLP